MPPLTGRVVDRAAMLRADVPRIEQAIQELERASGGQMAVLTVPALDGDALESFSLRVAEGWRIGRKGSDNGAVLLIARDDRQMRLEIGYGWEGEINDARAGDIIRQMGPFFREGRYGDGVVYAVQQVQRFVTGQEPAAPVPPPAPAQQQMPTYMLVLIVLFVVLAMALHRRGSTIGGRGYGGSSRGFGGSFGGGGFSGGGGSFGGGGASGRW